MTAKARRLARIFKEDGRAFVVPIDHAVTSGPIAGIEHPARTIATMAGGGADAMIVHRGLVTGGQWPADAGLGLIVHLSGGSALSGRPELKAPVCAVEDAVRLGADAVSVHVSLGTGADGDALAQLGRTASACEEWGMPLLAMMYVYREARARATSIVHAARIGAELGADCVKVDHPGEGELLEELVSGCFCKVMIAGGERIDDHRLLLRLEEAIAAGAAGACVGRNAYQHDRPGDFARALAAVVHGRETAGEAIARIAEVQREPEPHLV